MRDEVTGKRGRLHNEELSDLVLFSKYYLGDEIKTNEMGGACGMYGRYVRCIQAFGEEN